MIALRARGLQGRATLQPGRTITWVDRSASPLEQEAFPWLYRATGCWLDSPIPRTAKRLVRGLMRLDGQSMPLCQAMYGGCCPMAAGYAARRSCEAAVRRIRQARAAPPNSRLPTAHHYGTLSLIN